MRLAFDATAGERRADRRSLQIDLEFEELAELVTHLGEEVLLFRGAATAQTEYVGTGALRGLVCAGNGFAAVLDGCQDFQIARTARPGFSVIRDRWRGIHDREYQVLTEQPSGLSEQAQTMFAPSIEPPATSQNPRALEVEVLVHYDQMCAVSEHNQGRRIVAAPIRPIGDGGVPSAGNCIALADDAAEAFSQFHLTIGGDLELIVDLSRIDPELLERLNANGYCRLPADRAARPASAALIWHRKRFQEITGID